eukprot:GAFH01002305.1.p1 GENE.GAFH01002305.1~~GAFH01002305.1.p1  ORF type:complete len:279 (+),score=11.65 GAFH01002305.1:37-837(+)
MPVRFFLLFLPLVLCAPTVDITVRVWYREARLCNHNVFIRGDLCGLSWDVGTILTHKGNDNWESTLHCTASDAGKTISMKVLVDDSQWQVGTNDQFIVPTRSGGVAELYPWFFTSKGSYELMDGGEVFSPQLNNTRPVVVYTPPSYLENPHKPLRHLLVMHDGQNLFNDSTSFIGEAWRVQEAADELITGGQTDEFLIVGPYNTADRMNEYTYSYDPKYQVGGKGDLYLQFVRETLLPLVQKRYRLTADATLGMMGSSLGGPDLLL